MISLRLPLGAAVLLALAGCAATTPAPLADASRLNGEWLQQDSAAPIRLDIKERQLSARAGEGCNGMFGGFTLDGDRLQVGPLASTMMMCAPEAMRRDQALGKLLAAKPALSLQGEVLTLQAGQETLRFARQPEGVRKLIYVAAERKPCVGVAPMQCLQVREDKSQPWLNHYGEIEGFKPEPGIAYRLRIKEIAVANPPADAPSKRWVLDMVVEQEAVGK
nr:META and DUF4377 domain-containing protein [Chromobacterium sp. ASV5]